MRRIIQAGLAAVVWLAGAFSGLWAQGYPIDPFKAAANQVSDNFEQVTHSYDLCREAVERSKAASTTPNDPGYAAMIKPLADLTTAWNVLKADADQVAQTKAQFKLLYGTDKEIQPSDPRWKPLNDLKDVLQKQLSTYQNDANQYVKAGNAYAEVGGKYKFGWAKVSDLLDPLVQRMGYRKKEIAKLREIAAKVDGLKLEGNQVRAGIAVKADLKENLDDWRDLQDGLAAFQKQCAGQEYLFGGPGVPPVTAPGELSRKMKKMKHRYKQAISQWKTIDPKVVDDSSDSDND